MVGNYAQVISGTNFTVGVYEIISVVAGVSITVDRNCTTAAGALGVVNIGGAFATVGKALAIMTVTGMQCYIKATATYTMGTGLTTPAGVSHTAGIARLIGYTTTRGDNGQATLQATGAIILITDSTGGFRFENLTFDGNSTGTVGLRFNTSNGGSFAWNCIFKRCTDVGLHFAAQGNTASNCQVTANGGATNAAGCYFQANYCAITNSYINANTTNGIRIVGTGCFVDGNIISSNSSGGHGVLNTAYTTGFNVMRRNVFYSNGGDGINNASNYNLSEISNNIFVSNGGWGINNSIASPIRDDVIVHHNAYYNNTSGARNGLNAGTGDVILTGVPFTNAAGGDFSLNNTASQGAACRSVGFPGVLIAGGTGYEDIGALRHQDAASGAAGGSYTFVG